MAGWLGRWVGKSVEVNGWMNEQLEDGRMTILMRRWTDVWGG